MLISKSTRYEHGICHLILERIKEENTTSKLSNRETQVQLTIVTLPHELVLAIKPHRALIPTTQGATRSSFWNQGPGVRLFLYPLEECLSTVM